MYRPDVPFEILQGKTLKAITGLHQGSDEVIFETTDGNLFRQHHHQDCCESVDVNDVVGDVDDLLNTPILLAEEATQEGAGEGWGTSTWTFYKLRTIKGSVDIRWYGSSNGYYSEGVSFERTA